MVRDVIVVGAGIIGATAAKALRDLGRDVLLLDSGEIGGGTGPSGGHLKPSWLGVAEEVWKPSMDLLDAVWGLKKETFKVFPSETEEGIHRVDTDEVMSYPKTAAVVTSVRQLNNYPIVTYKEGAVVKEERCRILLVAAGVWCESLLGTSLGMKRKQGVSFRLRGVIDKPFIQPWAPYKQIVAHQQGAGEIWIGDGTAVLDKNWTEGRTEACKERCLSALPGKGLLSTRTGLRPYCPHNQAEPCLYLRLGPRAFLATGAGKRGTIAAGWVAGRLLLV